MFPMTHLVVVDCYGGELCSPAASQDSGHKKMRMEAVAPAMQRKTPLKQVGNTAKAKGHIRPVPMSGFYFSSHTVIGMRCLCRVVLDTSGPLQQPSGLSHVPSRAVPHSTASPCLVVPEAGRGDSTCRGDSC